MKKVGTGLLADKHLQYGDIWGCPHAGTLIAARMLDKARRLIQMEYLRDVLADFGDIPGVKERIGDLESVTEDTVYDLEGYIVQYKRKRNGAGKPK